MWRRGKSGPLFVGVRERKSVPPKTLGLSSDSDFSKAAADNFHLCASFGHTVSDGS